MFKTIACALSSLPLLAACASEPKAPVTPPPASATGYLYVGACQPSDCDGLPVPEIGCPDGQPRYVCSSNAAESACRVSVICNEPDNGSVSFSPCEESACGPKPATPGDACPAGHEWGAPQCGNLNDSGCSWAQHCQASPSDEACDDDACGPKPEIAVVCDDGSSTELACRKVGNSCSWQSPCR